MKKWLLVLVLLMLLPLTAQGEMILEFAADQVSLGGIVDFEIQADGSYTYQYSLFRNGKELFTGVETPYAFGSYLPREAGEYTLHVIARDANGQTEETEGVFQVVSVPECSLSCDQESVRAGEPLLFTAQVNGGVGSCQYVYSVWLGNEKIIRQESEEPYFSYTPGQAGEIRVEVVVTDAEGNQASASATAQVEEGEGISLSGADRLFYAQGGSKTYFVHAPGVWMAETDADFLTLSQHCGASGDPLTIVAAPCDGEKRTGEIRIFAGEHAVSFRITQSAGLAGEDEISFSPVTDHIWINGQDSAVWADAAGERIFDIAATGDWQAETDQDFISLKTGDGILHLIAEENDGEEAREGMITLSCGNYRAYIHLLQPGVSKGASVLQVAMERDHGIAYQDVIPARVITSGNLDELVISCAAWEENLVYERSAGESLPDGTLFFLVEIPLMGSGEQAILFSAANEFGMEQKQCAMLAVTPENAAFGPESARLILDGDENLLSFRVTAAAQAVEALDETGNTLAVYQAESALIDRCVTEGDWGRYADWSLSLSADALPSFLRIGQQTIPVLYADAAEKELILYSQSDGYWKDQPYRHSTLEHSGCAIFALSHALQLLGYEGEEILPQKLADTYASCLLEGGTMNSALVGRAGDNLGFKTRYELYENLAEIRKKMEQGAVFSFAVVNGHIAMVAGVSEDGSKFRIIDSAPSATLERIKNSSIYIQDENGAWQAVTDLAQIPGLRYFIENNAFAGAEYYLDAAYVAKRGVRLIQPE